LFKRFFPHKRIVATGIMLPRIILFSESVHLLFLSQFQIESQEAIRPLFLAEMRMVFNC